VLDLISDGVGQPEIKIIKEGASQPEEGRLECVVVERGEGGEGREREGERWVGERYPFVIRFDVGVGEVVG
jgi:hypothetical protein